MRYNPIATQLFVDNRSRLAGLLPPNALAVINANDICPTNADGSQNTIVNSDLFYLTVCECDHVYLNSNEHKRAVIEVENRDARFVAETKQKYPLHNFRQLAPLMCHVRAIKSAPEVQLIRKACDLAQQGFLRVLKFTSPGVYEYQVEAEFAHVFTRHGGRMADQPIIGAGLNVCCLHYLANDQICRLGHNRRTDHLPSRRRIRRPARRQRARNGLLAPTAT